MPQTSWQLYAVLVWSLSSSSTFFYFFVFQVDEAQFSALLPQAGEQKEEMSELICIQGRGTEIWS